MKTPDQILSLIKNSIDESIQKFGSYNFFDKGPWEVLDYDTILNEMKSLDPTDAVKVCEELYSHGNDGTGEFMAESLLDDLGYSL